MFGKLENYQPPEWAAALSYIPKKRVQLAMGNTPIHPWKVPGVPADFKVGVKRDDLTGCALSGNKIRRLEFFLADALDQGCSHVITCGPIQSNHCRAVALSARLLGLTAHLFLRHDAKTVGDLGCEGNMLLNRLSGAHIRLVSPQHRFQQHVMPEMTDLAHRILASTGETSYLIPVGGSGKTGLFGCVVLFQEFIQQGVLQQYDDLVFPCGSGGTAAGLAIANYLTGGHLRLHGFTVCDNISEFYEHVDESLQAVGLGHLRARDLVRFVDAYKGEGYAISTRAELDFIQKVAADTSVVLDSVYGAKAALGMVTELQQNPSAFQGSRVLYIHTGGLFGLFDGRMRPVLDQKEERGDAYLPL